MFVIVCSGSYCEDHEDEEGFKTPAAFGGSAEPAFFTIQTSCSRHQGNAMLILTAYQMS